MGYPVSETFERFIKRHKLVAFEYGSKPEPTRENCEVIISAIGLQGHAFGNEKVSKCRFTSGFTSMYQIFFKFFHPEVLATHLQKHGNALLFVQKVPRFSIQCQLTKT